LDPNFRVFGVSSVVVGEIEIGQTVLIAISLFIQKNKGTNTANEFLSTLLYFIFVCIHVPSIPMRPVWNATTALDPGQALVVGLLLHPASRASPEDPLPAFIKDEYEDGEGDAGDPPVDLQWVHLEALVHAWSVGQEGSQACLTDQAKVHGLVGHALLKHRVFAGLADDQVSPLNHHNGHQECCVAGVLQHFSVFVGPFLTIAVF